LLDWKKIYYKIEQLEKSGKSIHVVWKKIYSFFYKVNTYTKTWIIKKAWRMETFSNNVVCYLIKSWLLWIFLKIWEKMPFLSKNWLNKIHYSISIILPEMQGINHPIAHSISRTAATILKSTIAQVPYLRAYKIHSHIR
jgi:hypothetical protein